MNRILDIIDSDKSDEEKLNEYIKVIKSLEKKYGCFCYENNELFFVENQKESEYMRNVSQIKSRNVQMVAEQPAVYEDKVVNALEKEYRDKRIIRSFVRKVNQLPSELKDVFVLRMIKKLSVNKIKERLFLSNKRYYQYIYLSKLIMIRKMSL